MAATYYSNPSMGDEQTNLGKLWEEALNEYYAESGGTDLRGTDSSRWNMGRILAEQEDQLQLFSHFRHDKGMVDKLRTLVSKNTAIIQNVATYVVNASSTAFPPSAAILTAFNYVMNASKAVSDDYDMILQFFDITHSFLERVSMLENRMPGIREFQKFLLDVFKALLTLCAIARKYRMGQGRLKKWAKALVEGSDPKLKEAFDSLHTQIQRFEQATMIATLRTSIDTSRKIDSYGKEFKTIQAGVNQTIDLGQQGLAVGQQTLAQGKQIYVLGQQTYSVAIDGKGFAKDAAVKAKEILEVVTRQDGNEAEQTAAMKRIEQNIERMRNLQQRGKISADQNMDCGARKSTTLRMLQNYVYDVGDTKDQLNEIDDAYINGTFQWLRDLDIFHDLETGGTPLVWLTGPPGMGKSTLTYVMEKALREEFDGEPSTLIASFFFREDDDTFRTAEKMLKSCSIQVATQNTRYRQELLADIQRNQNKWWDDYQNTKKLWKRLFTSMFTKDSGRRVVLLLDGVDDAETDSIKDMLEIIKYVSDSGTNIQIMFSSDPDFLDEIEHLKVTRFDLDKKKVEKDMKLIAMARMKQLSRLRKLRSGTKAKICRRLCKKADSIRYIDHMLRRLNAIGREGPIVKELDCLPENTTELYKALLNDCQLSRTDEDRVVLKKFFAWLAYAKEPLRLGSATKLLKYIAKDSTISVDEEVEHRSARILRLSNATWYSSQETDVSENETDKAEDDTKDNGDEESFEDLQIFLCFQERSLRQYFREKETEASGLRSSPSLGHMMIFEAIVAILTTTSTKNSYAETVLSEYSTKHWMTHLFEIKGDELTDDQAARVIECLHSILSNKNNALKVFETNEDIEPSIFGSSDEEHEKARNTLKEWASRAIHISSSILSSGTAEWMRPLFRNPDIIYIRMAESHVANWFIDPRNNWQADRSFMFAHAALERGKVLLQQHPELRTYFAEREKAENKDITQNSILVISKSFWQMQMTMTAQCYKAIGMAMKAHEFFEASLEQFSLGLKNADDDRDKLQMHSEIGGAFVGLAEQAENEEKEKNKKAKIKPDSKASSGSKDEAQQKIELEESKPVSSKPDWAQKACDALSEAAGFITKVSYSEDLDKDVEIKSAIVKTYTMRAKAEILQGKSDNLIQYLKEAMEIPLRDKRLPTYDILEKLASREEWSKIIELFKIIRKEDRLDFAMSPGEGGLYMQQAGKQTGDSQFVIDIYEEAAKLLLSWDNPLSITVYTLVPLASFYRTVIGGPEAFTNAKAILSRILAISNNSWAISDASFQLADILVEEFRGTRDPNKKMIAQGEMKVLVSKMIENMGNEFDWTQSQTTIPLAYMTRKLAAVEFQKGLDATFQGCVGLLRDSTIENDSQSLRILARVLAYVPGLERDAQIAATCQLYVVDMELYKRENESDVEEEESGSKKDSDGKEMKDSMQEPPTEKVDGTEVNGVKGDTNDEADTTKFDQQETALTNGVVKDGEEKLDAIIKGVEKEEKPESDEDLDPIHGLISCNNCLKVIQDWHNGAVYLCYYCTELNLCEECYNKKVAREKGELPPDWRTLCPVGHKHIKAPVEGWKGIKDGVMRFETENIKFDTWLLELKGKKWPEAWERFWSEEMRE